MILSLALLATQSPFCRLLATYPRGEQLGCAVTEDGTRAFVADGATIAVLDLAPPQETIYTADPGDTDRVIQWIELSDVPTQPTLPFTSDDPDPTPQEMVLFPTGTSTHTLFIAGGTAGLFGLELDNSLLTSIPDPLPPHVLTAISGPIGDAGTFRWKRCVDVAIVEQASRTLVIGLFAASEAQSASGQESMDSEILAWELGTYGPPNVYGRKLLTVGPVPGLTTTATDVVARSLAVDPEDPNSLYIALGIRWLWRLDISAVTGTGHQFGSLEQIDLGSVLPCNPTPTNPTPPCSLGERMTDLTIVREPTATGTRALAYATLDYGRLLEIELPTVPSVTPPVAVNVTMPICGFAKRVSAKTDPAGNVVVAVAFGSGGSIGQESGAPFTPDGIWSNPCAASGLEDTNQPNVTPRGGIRVYRRSPGATLSMLVPVELENPPAEPAPPEPGRIETTDISKGLVVLAGSPQVIQVFESNSQTGFALHEIARIEPVEPGFVAEPVPWHYTLRSRYVGPAEGAGDGTTSVVDDTLLYIGGEPVGQIRSEGYMFRIEPIPGTTDVDLLPVPNTVSVCPDRFEPMPREVCAPTSTFGIEALGDPNPFLGGVLGCANWTDPLIELPAEPVQYEWFFAASPSWRYDTSPCTTYPGEANCAYSAACDPRFWRKSWLSSLTDAYWPAFPGLLADQSKVGWKFVKLLSTATIGTSMDMHWWQVVSQTATPETRAESVDLLFSANDPRFDVLGINCAQVPKAIYGIRGGSENGLKVMSTQVFMTKAGSVCSGQSTLDQGKGQELTSDYLVTSAKPAFFEVRTHVELEPFLEGSGLEPCLIQIPIDLCSDLIVSESYRRAFNQKCDVFPVQHVDGGGLGTNHVIAVACGFVTAGATTGQSSDCQWEGEFDRLMVTLYDVEESPGDAQGLNKVPKLLRVALGPHRGHAFALRAKSYPPLPGSSVGQNFLFVADLTGRLVIFDVSGDTLFVPAASKPYRSSTYEGGGAGTPVVQSLSAPGADHWSMEFPVSPIDGKRPNCTDIEIDGNYAYMALARAGIAVIDISIPTAPVLVTIMDTPGIWPFAGFRRRPLRT